MSEIMKPNEQFKKYSSELFKGIAELIHSAQMRVAVSLNAETTLLYWNIGNYINKNLKESGKTAYGKRIIATLSQQLNRSFGKGYTYTALTRMCKVAEAFNKTNIATLSQQLNWSHLIELSAIDETTKREFYQQLSVFELLMLDEKKIKVAQYLTELPSKQWFADKLHRSMEIVKTNAINHD